MPIDRKETLKLADAALKKAGIGGLGRLAAREYVSDAIEKAAEDGRQYGRLQAAAECAELLETSCVMLPIIPEETKQDRCARFALAFAMKIRSVFNLAKISKEN